MHLRYGFPVVYAADTAGGDAAGSGEPSTGAGGAAPPGSGGADGAGGRVDTPPASNGEAKSDTAPAGRPEWLPEKFADGAALAKSYAELESAFGGKQEKLREQLATELAAKAREGVPEKPEGYEFTPPEGLLPEGFEFKVDASDPLLGEMRGLMHELGAKPEQWNRAMTAFLRWQADGLPKPHEEKAKLGEGAERRIEAVDAWLAKALPEREYKALAGQLGTADAIAGIERIMRAAGGGSLPGAAGLPGGAGGGDALTPQQARELMSHPDYRDERKGAEMRARVRAFVTGGGRVSGY
jgi:hypothetical protein